MDDFSFLMVIVTITGIVSHILKTEDIDENESLYKLGADNIDITEIVLEIEKVYGVDLSCCDKILNGNEDITIVGLAKIVKSKL